MSFRDATKQQHSFPLELRTNWEIRQKEKPVKSEILFIADKARNNSSNILNVSMVQVLFTYINSFHPRKNFEWYYYYPLHNIIYFTYKQSWTSGYSIIWPRPTASKLQSSHLNHGSAAPGSLPLPTMLFGFSNWRGGCVFICEQVPTLSPSIHLSPRALGWGRTHLQEETDRGKSSEREKSQAHDVSGHLTLKTGRGRWATCAHFAFSKIANTMNFLVLVREKDANTERRECTTFLVLPPRGRERERRGGARAR